MASVLSPVNCESVTNLLPESTRCIVVAIAKAGSRGGKSRLYAVKVDSDNDLRGSPFHLSRANCKGSQYIWENDDISKQHIRFGTVVKYRKFEDKFIYAGKTTEARWDVDRIQMALDFGENVHRGIKEACPKVKIGQARGMHLESKPEKPIIFLVSLKSGVIKNERITFITESGEQVNLKLNCRENLNLLTSRVPLQLRKVTGEDDVGDVAVLKFGTSKCCLRNPFYPGVCEGLILKHNPLVISTNEEPAKIKNKEGNYIFVPGEVKVDTANDCCTAISRDLVDSLDLEVDNQNRMAFTCAGGVIQQCSSAMIELKIRRRVFTRHALVDATAPGTDLLIGKDILDDLHDENYTIGL